jgi:hypothetical protein
VTRPGSPFEGQVIYETDTNMLWVCTNTTGPVWAHVGPTLVFGTYTARTTSGTTETASFADATMPAQPVAGKLLVSLAAALTGTVAGDVFNVSIKVAGAAAYTGRVRVADATSVATPWSSDTPVALAANTAGVITCTLQRIAGTGTLAAGSVALNSSLSALFVPDTP